MILNRALWRVCLIVLVFLLIVGSLYEYRRREGSFHLDRLPFKTSNNGPSNAGSDNTPTDQAEHPIDKLISQAEQNFSELRDKEAQDVKAAADAYRKRRGRHPPPDFGKWVAYAKQKNAVLIEDLFDKIYDDLEPFWAIEPKILQSAVSGMKYVLNVRNGTLKTTESHDGHHGIGGGWLKMFQELKPHLPDCDIAFNVIDEPRLLVPWDSIQKYLEMAKSKGPLVSDSAFPSVAEFHNLTEFEQHFYGFQWMTSGNYWVLAREACPPDTPGRTFEAITDFVPPPEFPAMYPHGTYRGYVSNWTMAKDPCSHPHLRGMHGTFIAPKMIRTSKDLFPIFGGSKLSLNNDILLPPPEYWDEADSEDSESGMHWWEHFSGKSRGWSSKDDKAFWRGPATGGINRRETWARFQRPRLVSMMNSSHVAQAQSDGFKPQNFPLPSDRRKYAYTAADQSTLADWLGTFADAAFTDLQCFGKAANQTGCRYSGAYYDVVHDEGMWKLFANKYIPDVDGDAFSTRFLALLRSASLPIKATLYSEWHDSRLVPWKHFVPMDNTFVDFWGIMDYFLAGRDARAKAIADEGRKWAQTVLRREDMLVYLYRLMLEYARLMDGERDHMGFVEDMR